MSRINEVLDYLKKNNYDVEIITVNKNGKDMKGIKFNLPGDVNPVCYESAYPSEMTAEEIAEDMILAADEVPEFDLDFSDYETAKEKLFPCLGNEEATAKVTRRNFCGQYYEYVRYFVTDEQSFAITSDILEVWGISENELFGMARANAAAEERFISDRFLGALYILTSDTKTFGAAAVLDNTLLDKACDDLDCDKIYILPSSIHELIILPGDSLSADDITDIVKEVNGLCNSEMEYLGDDIMVYDNNNRVVEIA